MKLFASDFDLRPSRRGGKKYFSLFYCLHCAYTETGWKGVVCKWLIFGGPCRGRTYGPLIKSEAEGVAQVIDSLGNPLLALSDSRRGFLSHLVSVHLTSTRFVASANTVLTPVSIGTPPGWAYCGVMALTRGIYKRRI